GSSRAFVDSITRMRWSRTSDPHERSRLVELLDQVRRASLRSHAALRARIAAGTLRGAVLRKYFDDIPIFERDHFVEEVLGIAYPPLDEPAPLPELMGYCPSGYEEIIHAFDLSRLGPGDHLLDIGSGAGKVVMLAALLAGAKSSGVDHNASL